MDDKLSLLHEFPNRLKSISIARGVPRLFLQRAFRPFLNRRHFRQSIIHTQRGGSVPLQAPVTRCHEIRSFGYVGVAIRGSHIPRLPMGGALPDPPLAEEGAEEAT